MNIRELTIKKFNEGLKNKEFSAEEATQGFFDYIKGKDEKIDAYLSLNEEEGKDKKIKAYLRLNEEEALKQAKEVDEMIAKGEEIGVLAGVPLAIKDNILIKGLPATAASKILENYKAVYDATVIKKLKNERAVFLGKANMDEFAMGSSTENSAFKKTRNPYDLTRVPGGSSGGSAAAVSADMAVAALGSDTGGSIRQPASFCGIVGFKPTYGAVSRFGLIAMASSLDQIGPITKTVEDAEILFNVIKGKDELDATSVGLQPTTNNLQLSEIKKLTIGVPKEYFNLNNVDKNIGLDLKTTNDLSEAIEKFNNLGFKIKQISLPHTKYALSVYYIIMTAEVSANLARFDGLRYSRICDTNIRMHANDTNNTNNLLKLYLQQRGMGFGMEAKRRIILGTYVLSSGYYDAYYAKAQRVRRLIKEDFDKAFEEVDIIFAPVSPTTAFGLGEKFQDPLQMYLSDIFTIPVNLAGLPGISIPVRPYKKGEELPVGFQLIGKHFREEDILGLGKLYEQN